MGSIVVCGGGEIGLLSAMMLALGERGPRLCSSLRSGRRRS
jgi:hypothetical protein